MRLPSQRPAPVGRRNHCFRGSAVEAIPSLEACRGAAANLSNRSRRRTSSRCTASEERAARKDTGRERRERCEAVVQERAQCAGRRRCWGCRLGHCIWDGRVEANTYGAKTSMLRRWLLAPRFLGTPVLLRIWVPGYLRSSRIGGSRVAKVRRMHGPERGHTDVLQGSRCCSSSCHCWETSHMEQGF